MMLRDEGTTYKSIVDQVRCTLAAQHIAEPQIAMGEIACLLGFSTHSAFGRAFRRWHGLSPLEQRLRINAQEGAAELGTAPVETLLD